MNVPLRAICLMAGVLFVVGWPAARVVSRSRTWAAAATPAVGGIAVSIAVAASILSGTSMLPWLAVCAVSGWALFLRRRSSLVDEPSCGSLVLWVAVLVALAPVVLVDIPPVESDARYIWWFHAAWFRGGGSVAREGMEIDSGNFLYSRSRYPPLLPGVIAAVWHFSDAYAAEMALRVSQLFTAAAIAAAAFHTAFVAQLTKRGAAIIAAIVAGMCWAANAGVGLVGFVDLAWAALFVSAAVLLLAGHLDRRVILIGSCFASAAALVKFEGQVAGIILVVVVLLRAGREWRRVLPVVCAVFASIVAWQAVVSFAGAPPDNRGNWSDLVHLLDSNALVHQRFVTTVGHLADQLGWLVGLSVIGILVTVAAGRGAGLRLRQPGTLSILVVCAAYLTVLAFTSAVAPEDLDGYLEVAAYRAVIVVRILVLVDLTMTCLASARALGVLATPDASAAAGCRLAGASEPAGEVATES